MSEYHDSGSRSRSFLVELLAVLLGLVVLSVLIRTLDLDIRLARLFYRPDTVPHWWAKDRQPWEAIYDLGVWPANLVGVFALFGLIASLFRSVLHRYRRTLLYLLLVWAVGPGLLVNMVGKEHIGRPRPRQTVEFGGTERFLPVGETGIPGEGESFPSGHAAIGFYFVSFYLLMRSRRRRAARAFLAAGIGAGALIGVQRITSGGHFLSDVLWSGGTVYLTALTIDWVMPRDGRRVIHPLIPVVVGAVALGLAVLGTPYYRATESTIGPFREGLLLRIESRLSDRIRPIGEAKIGPEATYVTIRTEVRGYGPFDNDVIESLSSWEKDDTLRVEVAFLPRRRLTRLTTEVSFHLGAGGADPAASPAE